MDQRERAADLLEVLRTALDGRQAAMWQGGPGIVQSFDPVAMTCVVQPAIQGRVQDRNGVVSYVNLPLLLDVPVYFPGGGGCAMTFGVAQGDECWFSIADRCIDAWWQSGGVQPPMEARMHDLSDAFAFVGVYSQPRVLANVSANKAQLRSTSGDTTLELDPAAKAVNITAPGGATLTANVKVQGDLHVTGKITADTGLAVTGGATLDTLKVTTSADLANGAGTYIKTVAGQSTTAKA